MHDQRPFSSLSGKLRPRKTSTIRKGHIRDRNTTLEMPRKKRDLILSQPAREGLKTFKVQLDARTVITLASKKAFDFWKQKYPNAVIIG